MMKSLIISAITLAVSIDASKRGKSWNSVMDKIKKDYA